MRDELWVSVARRPLVCLTPMLVLGIIWADLLAPPVPAVALLCLVMLGLAAFAVRADLPGASYLLLVGMFLLGASLHAYRIAPWPGQQVPARGLELPRVEGIVTEVQRQSEYAQTVVLLTGQRKVQLAVPSEPALQAGNRVALSEVSLWRPRRSGTPGEPDEARELAREGIHAVGRAQGALQVLPGGATTGLLHEALAPVRRRMLDRLTEAMPGPEPGTYAQLLASMVYGMRAVTLPEEITELFRRTGTIHLLVVSGTQVTIIALSLIFLVRGTRRVLPGWGMVAVIAGLVCLALLAGLGASVNRAVAMAIVLLGTFAAGRQYDFPTALGLSALVLCVLNTATVFDLGAQLTYACSIGVYLALPAREAGARPRTWLRWFHVTLRGTLGAWAFSLPIIAWHFHSVVLLGALANLVAIPLSVALLYLGLAAIGAALVAPALATPVCWAARLLLETLLGTVRAFVAVPGASLDNVYLSPGAVLVWYLAVVGALWAWRTGTPWRALRHADRRWALAIAVAAAGTLFLVLALRGPRDQRLRLDVLDVGAGQCILLRTGAGAAMIDAGTEPFGTSETRAEQRLLGFLALQRVRRLDALIITHAHEDHCNLAAEVLRAVPTRQLLLGPDVGAEHSWHELVAMAQEHGPQPTRLQAGGRLMLGPATLEALEPTRLLRGTDEDANNNSVVLRLTYGRTSILLPSDLQAEGERRLLQDYAGTPLMLDADLLVAAHHGSVNSNHAAFVDSVTPRQVVVSCGRGARAPRARGLRVFMDRKLPLWRTDLHGSLQIVSDGQEVSVRGYRKQ